MAKHRVPVVIVAGFLGSGKTTLLNHLLAGARGTRVGVVVNDFGSVNVDALSVAGQVDSMMSFENGCLCCAVDASGLDAMLGRLTGPGSDLDLVVIEASGLAEPRSLVRLVLASEHEHVGYGGLVEVVDGAEFERTRARHPELDEHLRLADLVVLNKLDRAGGEDAEARLTNLVRELAGATPVLPVTHGRVDPELLFDPARREDPVARQLSFEDLREETDEHGDHSRHAHALYDTVTFSSGDALHPRRFARFLESRPTGLYRMKGSVRLAVAERTERYVVHTVGSYARITPPRRSSGAPVGNELVLIGAGLDGDALLGELRACLVEPGEDVDEQSMLPVLRYVERADGDGGSAGLGGQPDAGEVVGGAADDE